jgi:hypothetical protein
MRLTLRVLLAYLDNILEPADAATVEAKIAESEKVSLLVHHIREISKRVRIPAPDVLGKGLGLDPNTVAEYLDYGMTDDAVRDFENICTNSDVHMAEVAACHEILSLVLVKPAEIDPNSRQRMYALLDEAHKPLMATPLTAEPVAATAPSAPQRAPAAAAAPAETRRKSEVPDYLRQPDDAAGKTAGRFALAAAILFALVIAGGAAALRFVPHDNLPGFMQDMAATMFGNGPAVAVVDKDDLAPPLPTSTASGTPTGTAAIVAVVPTGTGLSTAGLRQPESAITPAVPAATGVVAVVAPIPPVPAGTPAPVAVAVATGTPAAMPATVAGNPTTVVIPAPTGPAGTVAPVTVVPAPGTTVAVVGPPVANPPVAAVPAKIEAVGRVSSDPGQVILRFDARAGWVRLQTREQLQLMSGDRLIALPTFRPQLTLAGGLTVDLLGGTSVELLPLDASGTPGVRLLHGRMTMVASGTTTGKLVLEVGARRATFTLNSAEFAVQHAFHRPRGIDPLAGPLPWSLAMYLKSGEVVISDDKGPSPSMKGPGSWLITGTSPLEPLTMANLPAWISADERDLLEKQAGDFVEAALREGKAVNVALEEVVDDRRIENQQLALRCQAQLGDFSDFTGLLRDPAQRWPTLEKYVELLSESIDYGPYHADRLREAFAKQAGPTKGSDLYRMMWGYSDEQLKGGVAKALVETLEHDDLDYRVLAFWNLSKITGQTMTYLPQDPPLKRRAAVSKWQQKLESGQIVNKRT